MARISSDTIQAINNETDIVSLISEYTRLEKRGADWWGLCPFHNEKTPSFHVIPDKKMYYCFGCGNGGGIINFLMEIDKLSFVEAVKYLANKNGIELKFDGVSNKRVIEEINRKEQILELYDRVTSSFQYLLKETKHGQRAIDYLTTRQISEQMIQTFRIGYAPKNRKWLFQFLTQKGYSSDFLKQSGLFSKKYPQSAFFSDRIMFPICDRKGQVVAFSARLIAGNGPKYINSSEMPQYKKGETLFGFNLAISEIRSTKSVIFCEGNMDVIAWHQAGFSRAVASLGTAFTKDQATLVRSFADTVYLSFDSDKAGEEATIKTLLLCKKLNFLVKIIQLHNGKDPSDVLVNEGPEALKKLVDYSILDYEYLILIASNRFNLGTPEGKRQASTFLFPYLEVLESDIQKESTIKRLSAVFGVSEKSFFSDFNNRHQRQTKQLKKDKTDFKYPAIKKNAELRIILSAISNFDLFTKLRSELNSDDFEDPLAKELFITLEECFRLRSLSFDTLFSRLENENLKHIVSETIHDGEFSLYAEKIINDGIIMIKANRLEKKKAKLLSEINLLNGQGSQNNQLINELIYEIHNIDNQLSKMKD